jgi:hypothetical protein
VAALLLAAAAVQPAAKPWSDAPSGARVPSVEERAPQVFGSEAQPDGALVDAVYRMDAQILLPMWVTSIRIAAFRDVGSGRLTMWEHEANRQRLVRAFQFFTQSFPERSHGVSRLGLFREVDEYLDSDGVSLAYFGAMSRSRERTFADAENARRNPIDVMTFDVIDGRGTPGEEVSTEFRVQADQARHSDARALYDDVRPGVAEEPRTTRRLEASAGPVPSRSFLGAMYESLRGAVSLPLPSTDRALPRRTTFAYNGRLHAIALTEVERDRNAARTFVGGLVQDANAVYRLHYELGREGQRAASEFDVWAELPPVANAAARGARAVVPLAFVLQPRSFLRLRFERVR